MNNIKIKRIINGAEEANCYLVVAGNELVVIDPGDESEEIIQKIDELGKMNYKYILLTHGHFDHVMAVNDLKKKFGFQVVIGKYDKDIKGLNAKFNVDVPQTEVDITVSEGDALDFGNEKIKVLSTPGHTKGSVCYLIGDNLFSGDTLFPHRHGRTDFATGNPEEMDKSLKRLFDLPGKTKVFPGHYEETTLGEARKYFN